MSNKIDISPKQHFCSFLTNFTVHNCRFLYTNNIYFQQTAQKNYIQKMLFFIEVNFIFIEDFREKKAYLNYGDLSKNHIFPRVICYHSSDMNNFSR